MLTNRVIPQKSGFRAAACGTLLLAGLVHAASAQVPAATAASPQLGAIAGVAYDSLQYTPLAHATVFLTRTTHTAITDSAGRYRIDSLAPGRYTITFDAPSLDSLGIEAPYRTIDMPAGANETVNLAVPSAPTILAQLCPPDALADDRGMLIGTVQNAATRAPLDSAQVVLSWKEWGIGAKGIQATTREIPTTTDAAGTYRFCGVPGDATVAVQARSGAHASGTIGVYVPKQGIVVRDLSVGIETAAAASNTSNGWTAAASGASAPHGTASLAGTITASGHPVRDADAQLVGTSIVAHTDSAGVFELADLPSGTQMLEVRRVGFVPIRKTVDLTPKMLTRVTVELGSRAVVLAPVHVVGHASAEMYPAGFLKREHEYQNRGGYFFDRSQIAKASTFRLSDLLHTVPGVELVPNGTGVTVQMRRTRYSSLNNAGDCPVRYFLDGVSFNGNDDLDQFLPSDIAAMEVYDGASTIPPQFGGARSSCGVIALWTRSGLAHRDSTATAQRPDSSE